MIHCSTFSARKYKKKKQIDGKNTPKIYSTKQEFVI